MPASHTIDHQGASICYPVYTLTRESFIAVATVGASSGAKVGDSGMPAQLPEKRMLITTDNKRQRGATLIEIWLIIGFVGALGLIALNFLPY